MDYSKCVHGNENVYNAYYECISNDPSNYYKCALGSIEGEDIVRTITNNIFYTCLIKELDYKKCLVNTISDEGVVKTIVVFI